MSLLTLHQLECERDYRILFTQLNFQCNEGDIVQIEGPNGCGKTTLLRVIAGLSTDFRGELMWRDEPLHQAYPRVLNQLLFVGHKTGIKKILSPRENLQWLCKLLPHHQSNDKSVISSTDIDEALEKVGLYGFEDVPCYQLSAGQQQRVVLARLCLTSVPLWILDEPLTALDSDGVGLLETLITGHADVGGCILLTTHQQLSINRIKPLNLINYWPTTIDQLSNTQHSIVNNGNIADGCSG